MRVRIMPCDDARTLRRAQIGRDQRAAWCWKQSSGARAEETISQSVRPVCPVESCATPGLTSVPHQPDGGSIIPPLTGAPPCLNKHGQDITSSWHPAAAPKLASLGPSPGSPAPIPDFSSRYFAHFRLLPNC